MSDKQLFSASEERLRYLTVDMGTSAIFILESIEYAECRRCHFECEPRCGSGFRLHQWTG
jgi:hypothetical protein